MESPFELAKSENLQELSSLAAGKAESFEIACLSSARRMLGKFMLLAEAWGESTAW